MEIKQETRKRQVQNGGRRTRMSKNIYVKTQKEFGNALATAMIGGYVYNFQKDFNQNTSGHRRRRREWLALHGKNKRIRKKESQNNSQICDAVHIRANRYR